MKKNSSSPIHYTQRNNGFALLLAVVIAGILISITFIMFSISLKQVTLSTTGKNSQYALYAADSGIECALAAADHIDKVFQDDQTTSDGNGNSTTVLNVPPIKTFNCNEQAITPTEQKGLATVKGVDYPNSIISTFIVNYPIGSTKCAYVTVTRYIYRPVDDPTLDHIGTRIESRGYNSCVNLDPQRLERGLEVYF